MSFIIFVYMEKEFAQYQEALELKELGFDEPCFAFFNGKHLSFARFDILGNPLDICNCLEAPTYSQAFRFFREKYKLDGIAFWNYTGYMWNIIDIEKSNKITNITIQDDDMEEYVTKEKSELECLKKLIKIVKEK